MKRHLAFLFKLTALIFWLAGLNCAQKLDDDRKMNQPVEPFKIIGNIYYVGASDVTSFLITTPLLIRELNY